MNAADLVVYTQTTMLLATPVAVIVAAVIAKIDANRTAKKVEAVAEKASEAAALLKANTNVAVVQAEHAEKKLDQIHVLVNSTMTAAIESELHAHVASRLLMLQLIELSPGKKASAELQESLKISNDKIAGLEAKLKGRAIQTIEASRGNEKSST